MFVKIYIIMTRCSCSKFGEILMKSRFVRRCSFSHVEVASRRYDDERMILRSLDC